MPSRLSLNPVHTGLILLIAFVACAAAGADELASAVETAQAQLPLVEVIATPFKRQMNTVQELTEADLLSARRRNVAEALNLLPGVYLTNVGARSEALVNVRGFDSRQVPVYIDGIPIYVPYDGNTDLNRITVRNIESIRVTRSGGSVLYGPNALGGAINVVTMPVPEGTSLWARGGTTLDDDLDQQSYETGLRAGFGGENWYGQAAAIWTDTDFFSIPGGEYGPAEDGDRRNNSSSSDLNASMKVGWRGDNGADVQLAYLRYDGEKDTPPYAGTDPGVRPRYWQWPYYDQQNFNLIAAVPLTNTLWARGRVFYGTFENSLESYDDDSYTTQNRPYAFSSQYDDYGWGGTAETEWAPDSISIVRGLLYYKRDVHREVDDIAEPQERQEDATWSVAGEYQRQLTGTITGIVGLGWNGLDAIQADNNLGGGVVEPFPLDDDSALNAQAGVNWLATADWVLGTSVARKTRFPTLKDRYSYRLGSAIPNPDLQAEQADHVELSATGTAWGTATGLTLFGAWIEDAILPVALPPTACTTPPCTQNQNVGRVRNQGVEITLSRELDELGLVSMNYTWLDAENLDNPQVKAVYIPENKFRLTTQSELGSRVQLILEFLAESGRYSQTNGQRSTAGFGLINASFNIDITRSLQLLVEGNNLADRLYAFDEGYPDSGRTYSFTLVWQPEVKQ